MTEEAERCVGNSHEERKSYRHLWDFPPFYAQATWRRLLLFFQLPGTITPNDCVLNRDLTLLCERVNQASPRLPDGRRLSFTIRSSCCILAAQKRTKYREALLITRDPLMIQEFVERGPGSGAPDLTRYVAYDTLTGSVGHLTLLGPVMGALLGLIGGLIGKGANLPQRQKRQPSVG